jgi:hypothetical protein
VEASQFQPPACFRSEGLAVSSPDREGGEINLLIAQRPEGAAQAVAHLSALRQLIVIFPRPHGRGY